MTKSIYELIQDYFIAHPNEELPHGPVVDWVTEEYLKSHSSPPRDIWRSIRKLHQQGFLMRVRKGIFKYNPDAVILKEFEDFSPDQKEEIFRSDNYRCVVCGLGRKDGVEICADHIKPRDLGGEATIQNGQTLCTKHNLLKKNLKQTETGKKMFIKLYDLAKNIEDEALMNFCEDVLTTYERHDINGHIIWKH